MFGNLLVFITNFTSTLVILFFFKREFLLLNINSIYFSNFPFFPLLFPIAVSLSGLEVLQYISLDLSYLFRKFIYEIAIATKSTVNLNKIYITQPAIPFTSASQISLFLKIFFIDSMNIVLEINCQHNNNMHYFLIHPYQGKYSS